MAHWAVHCALMMHCLLGEPERAAAARLETRHLAVWPKFEDDENSRPPTYLAWAIIGSLMPPLLMDCFATYYFWTSVYALSVRERLRRFAWWMWTNGVVARWLRSSAILTGAIYAIIVQPEAKHVSHEWCSNPGRAHRAHPKACSLDVRAYSLPPL